MASKKLKAYLVYTIHKLHPTIKVNADSYEYRSEPFGYGHYIFKSANLKVASFNKTDVIAIVKMPDNT